jgi:hypothetical protein
MKILLLIVGIYLLIGFYFYFSLMWNVTHPSGGCQPEEIAEGTCKLVIAAIPERPPLGVNPMIIITWPSLFLPITFVDTYR